MSIEINSKIPIFSAEATSSEVINNASIHGCYTVLYFYPKDDTPGCTTESQDFKALHPEFAALNCQIFGISRDSIQSHETFKAKYDMPFELISDRDEKLCTLFDVINNKKMYGKIVRGIERSTFLINPEGMLIAKWLKVKAPGHAQAVLDFFHTH